MKDFSWNIDWIAWKTHGVFTATSQTASWGMKQFDWENSCHYSWKISNLDTRMALGKNDISPSPSSDQQNQCWIKGSQVCINHMAGQEFEHHKPIVYWLVVDLPLWKIWKSVGMIISSIWNNQIRVPNHQPVYHIVYHVPMKIAISSLEWRKTYRIFLAGHLHRKSLRETMERSEILSDKNHGTNWRTKNKTKPKQKSADLYLAEEYISSH